MLLRNWITRWQTIDIGANLDYHSLGYTQDQWQVLADHLMAIARNCAEYDIETTPFGVKYKAAGSVGRPNHRPGNILTVWIVEDDDPPRLVTAFPDTEK